MNVRIKEYRWPLVLSALLIAFGSLPLIVGYAAQTPEQRFIGTYFDQPDYAVHLAMMHYGEQGGWDYTLRFTTEPHNPAYVRLFYVVLGHVGGWIHLPAAGSFQIARVLFGLLACLSIYRLFRRIFPYAPQRRLAFLLTLLGSGVGWFQVLFGLVPTRISPVDLWLIDAYPLFSINLFPHFSAVIAALAITLTAFLDHSERPRLRNLGVIAACAIFVQVVNPIAFVLPDLAMAGIFIFSCWKTRKFSIPLALSLCLIAIIQIPLLLYTFILLTRDPVWAIFTTQNATLSPIPVYYLLGFALFWPFALVGAIKAFRNRDKLSGWAVVWILCAFGLAYLPVAIQRRFLIAVTLPLAVLATPSLLDLSRWLSERFRLGKYTGAVVVAGLASMSSLLLVGLFSMNTGSRPANQFEPAALVQAVDWLGRNGAANDVVLAADPTSQLVAIRTPLRLFSGHEMETLHYEEKTEAIQRFYNGDQSNGWLEAQGINWVILGPHERKNIQGSPDITSLQLAYQNDLVSVFKVPTR
jgi:hypothetical protein